MVHSSLPPSSSSSSSADGDVLSVVGGLMGILKVSPEHQKAVQPAVDLINQQGIEIEQLRRRWCTCTPS